MPSVKGEFLSARPRQINFKQGRKAGESRDSFQVALIPRNDPHGFPAAFTASEEVFDQCADFARGEVVELHYLETAMDEKIAHRIESAAKSAVVAG